MENSEINSISLFQIYPAQIATLKKLFFPVPVTTCANLQHFLIYLINFSIFIT